MAASGKASGRTKAADSSGAKSDAASTGAAESSAKKPAAKKSAAKKPAAKQSPAKQATAKKSTTRQTPKTATKEVGKVSPQKEDEPRKLAVRAGEKPWTRPELDAVREVLAGEARRLREEIAVAESGIAALLRDNADAGGEDQADTGSKTFEREHEIALATSHREILGQTERALTLIEDGTYGRCESCGNPIGKARLKAFPRATLCMSCKEREERR